MRRKEVLFAAVIGGVVGAVLTMAAGSFSPLGAQNEVGDAEFDTITCRRMKVVDPDSGYTKVALGIHGTNGFIAVKGKPSSGLFVETAGVFISASEDSGRVRVYSPKGDVELAVGESRSGGVILIHDELKFPPGVESPFPRVVIGVNENGSGELLTRDKNGNRVK